MAREKGKGKAKRRDPRKGPSASSGKRPGKGTKKVAPPANGRTDASATAGDQAADSVRSGGTAKAPFSVGRAPRPPRPAAAKALALKAERAAAAEAARARTAAPPVTTTRRQESSASHDKPGEPTTARTLLSTLTVGYIAGATPGRWADTWAARNPQRRINLRPLSAAEQRRALDEEVDIAIVRLPLTDAGTDATDSELQVIPLYEEVPFVVVSIESELSLLDELSFDDLAGHVVIVPADDVLGDLRISGAIAPVFAPPATTEEAVATVAAGVGVVVVPQSLARLHRRKDVVAKPLRGGPVSAVALAWRADREDQDVTTFVGVVRGRKDTSSR